MSINSLGRTAQLLIALFTSREPTVPMITPGAKKPPLPPSPAARPLPRSTPEKCGISSLTVEEFLRAVTDDPTLNMHSVMISKNGTVITEAAFGAHGINRPKMTFSACKSITSLAVGMMIGEGKLSLDQRVADIFPEEAGPINRLRLKELTVRHLLTMTSGTVFNEFEAMTEANWIKGFLSSPLKTPPGREFNYNSINTYMLSAAVVRKSGESLTDYLMPRLFEPLGITDVYWEKCPSGIEIGGWWLYLRPEDMTKLAALVMAGGVWEGRSIVPADYLKEALSRQVEVSPDFGAFDYGYQIWVGRDHDCFLFNGMLGQNVIAFRNSGIILTSNGGNSEMFQKDSYFRHALLYFGKLSPCDTLPDRTHAYTSLMQFLRSTRFESSDSGEPTVQEKPRGLFSRIISKISPRQSPPPSPEPDADRAAWESLLSRRFAPVEVRGAIGFLPVVLQAVENTYTDGLREIYFTGSYPDSVLMHYKESTAEYAVPIGIPYPKFTDISFGGNIFTVAASGRAARDEDGRRVFVIRADFPETPTTRIIKLTVARDGITLAEDELPGGRLLEDGLPTLYAGLAELPLVSGIVGKIDREYLRYKISSLFSPRLAMREITEENHASASELNGGLAEENADIARKTGDKLK